MTTMLAIDPGAEHCGLAVFMGPEWRVVWTGEKTPRELFDWWGVKQAMWQGWDVVVMEEFRLYPGTAAAQSWSSMGTVEVIGVIRERCWQEGVELVMQPASVKKPVAAILGAKGIELTGKGGHSKDAQLHGWRWVLAQ